MPLENRSERRTRFRLKNFMEALTGLRSWYGERGYHGEGPMSAHRCRHCFAVTDYIHVGTTQCPECAPVTALTADGAWYHYGTKEGAIADRRAAELAKHGKVRVDPKDRPESAS